MRKQARKILCNDGEYHRVSVRVRAVKCGRSKCRVCRERGGHGPYAYAEYRADNRTRTDYLGRVVVIIRRKGESMAKIVTIDCPTPGCGQKIVVKQTMRGKPTGFCPECRFQFFVRDHRTAKLWNGDEGKPVAKSEPEKTPAPEKAAEKTKGRKDLWDV